MWTCINLQHNKPEKIFGYVLEYYAPNPRIGGLKRLGKVKKCFKLTPMEMIPGVGDKL
jgi:hypothetical protein